MKTPTAQIGKAGELLVQYKLLRKGIESSQLTTDSGIDLVAYSPKHKKPFTIQVKTNEKPKKAGGKGKWSVDWYLSKNSPADLVALVDLESENVWLMTAEQMKENSQQESKKGMLHLYMYTEITSSKKKVHASQFDDHLFEKQLII